jgi:1-acyl-sn-glycerol-3-phosphate acyltransferase
MREISHSIANRAASLFMKALFGYSARIYVVGCEHMNRAGGFLLASNHISHFDPFIISSVVPRKIDWMAMAEFFPLPIVGFFLRAVDAFPAERDRADRKTIRTAIERLKSGRIVGVFPEGGIRDGVRSLLEGAQLRAGASTLAHIAGVPIVPCVILGSDRLYAKRSWLPLRRTPVWIGFDRAISHFPELEKSVARARIEQQLTSAFQEIYAELREKFELTADDLPHPPQERMAGCRASASPAVPKIGNRSGRPTIRANSVRRFAATVVDLAIAPPVKWAKRGGDGALRR